jgi:antitoxin component of RelBE/YafQ-DinJ toxin-antitoxin module
MAKQQINFRIDQELLQAIKARAQKEGIPYTQWIRNACLSQLTVDPVITFDEEEEMDVYAPTAIHYSESNIQYSAATLQDDIQDWEQTESEHNTIAMEDTLPKAPETLPPEESSLQMQINHLSNRLRWESRYRQTLETQVYYLKSMLIDVVADLEEKIARIEHQDQGNKKQQNESS